jgi:phospholipase/carboxylesterase
MSTDLLPTIEVEPTGPHTATVVWLHGLGADGHDFVPAVPHLGLPENHGVRFVFPTAPSIPVTLNGGMVMPAWYDIRGMDLGAPGRNDSDGLATSVAAVRALVDRELTRGIDPKQIVIAGFSQGGAVAFELALTHPAPLAGLAALSTYIVDRERIKANAQDANRTLPILQCHGTFDPMVPLAFGEAARDFLVELDYVVGWQDYPMEHEVCMEELALLGRFISDALDLSPSA